MRFASRALRSSVVRVVAAFAPLAGCSEFHESAHDPIGNPPPPSCKENGLGCVPTTENPPPPLLDGGAEGPDASVCPAQEPASGAACDVEEHAPCTYGSYCGAHHVTCVQGTWRVQPISCNPPPVNPCPATAPAEGASCAWRPERCSYGSCDAGVAAIVFECPEASRWSVVERCGTPACPASQPTAGGVCSYAGPACGYGNCAGAPTLFASCNQGVWSLQQVSCNPPPPDTCPALAPTEGSSCTHNSGNTCVFSLSVGGQVLGDCVNGKWDLRAPDAGS